MYDLVVIGGGPAGLGAAIGAKKEGIENILVLEREEELGGILNQCIHNGFGLHLLGEELTGPEYADHFIREIEELQIPYKLQSMVIEIDENKNVTYINETEGLVTIQTKSIILAMGCRERPRGAINIPGSRCQGIYSAGTAQKLMNRKGKMVGKKAVIVGSGDIGLIMARRMIFEGGEVEVVVERMPYSGGLKRNIVQCLDDYNIPLELSHTVTQIHGKERVEGVTIAKLDEKFNIIEATKRYVECDTLFFSVGLVPENELSKLAKVDLSEIGGPNVNQDMHTSKEGIFACGNVVHVHDLVDYVTQESYEAARGVAKYLKNGKKENKKIMIEKGDGIKYTVPQYVQGSNCIPELVIKWRVDNIYKKCRVKTYINGNCIATKKERVLAPGEMGKTKIKELDQYSNIESIKIEIEEVL